MKGLAQMAEMYLKQMYLKRTQQFPLESIQFWAGSTRKWKTTHLIFCIRGDVQNLILRDFVPTRGETQICIKNESVHCREEGYIGLRNTSPSDLEISRGQGFLPPRPERLHKGEARGQFRGPRSAKSLHEGNLKVRVVKGLLEFFRKFIQMRTQASLRTKSQLKLNFLWLP